MAIDKPADRPKVPEVLVAARAYYAKDGNCTGGSLHIALDDGNLEDEHLTFCRDRAVEKGDEDGIRLADLLLQMTMTQRRKVYNGLCFSVTTNYK